MNVLFKLAITFAAPALWAWAVTWLDTITPLHMTPGVSNLVAGTAVWGLLAATALAVLGMWFS